MRYIHRQNKNTQVKIFSIRSYSCYVTWHYLKNNYDAFLFCFLECITYRAQGILLLGKRLKFIRKGIQREKRKWHLVSDMQNIMEYISQLCCSNLSGLQQKYFISYWHSSFTAGQWQPGCGSTHLPCLWFRLKKTLLYGSCHCHG